MWSRVELGGASFTYQNFIANFSKLLLHTLSVLAGELLFSGGCFGFLLNGGNNTPRWPVVIYNWLLDTCKSYMLKVSCRNATFTCALQPHFCRQRRADFFPHLTARRPSLWLISWPGPCHRSYNRIVKLNYLFNALICAIAQKHLPLWLLGQFCLLDQFFLIDCRHFVVFFLFFSYLTKLIIWIICVCVSVCVCVHDLCCSW